MGIKEKIENTYLAHSDFITVVNREYSNQRANMLFTGPNRRVFDACIIARNGKPAGVECFLEDGRVKVYPLCRFYVCINGKWVGRKSEDCPTHIYHRDPDGIHHNVDIAKIELEGKWLHEAAELAYREAKKGDMSREEYENMTATELIKEVGLKDLDVGDEVEEVVDKTEFHLTVEEVVDKTEFHLTVVEKDYSEWGHENVVTTGPKQKVYGVREAILPGGFRGIRACYKPDGVKDINVDLHKHYICIDGVWMDGQKPDKMFYTHSSERPDFKELDVDEAVREDEKTSCDTNPVRNPSLDIGELIKALKTIKNVCEEHAEQGGACATCPMSLCGDFCSIAKRPCDWKLCEEAREVVVG